MANMKFSVSWNLEKTLCNALSSLQQKGQFVDMTLAADGCFVKVHQLIIALASPYLKELITSAQCQHPIIFLNQISYGTLCSLLEYIYSGETMVSAEGLNELVEAGRALHIKGIQDMTIEHSSIKTNPDQENLETEANFDTEEMLEEANNLSFIEVTESGSQGDLATEEMIRTDHEESTVAEKQQPDYNERILGNTIEDDLTDLGDSGTYHIDNREKVIDEADLTGNMMQYTVSTQGSLQMILNRFIYYLKYTTLDNMRQWRCVDYVTKKKCPAYVISKGSTVIKRVHTHQHTYHDNRIVKKLRAQVVFGELETAQSHVKPRPGKKACDVSLEVETIEDDMEQ